METFVISLLLWLLLLFLTYLVGSTCQGFRFWTSRGSSQGHRKSLDTHRGPKSPAKASTLLLVGFTFQIFFEHYMTQLNPHFLSWRAGGSEPATGFGGANINLAQANPSMAKLSGLGPTPAHLEHQKTSAPKEIPYWCTPMGSTS